jgi:hypothetical protein
MRVYASGRAATPMAAVHMSWFSPLMSVDRRPATQSGRFSPAASARWTEPAHVHKAIQVYAKKVLCEHEQLPSSHGRAASYHLHI